MENNTFGIGRVLYQKKHFVCIYNKLINTLSCKFDIDNSLENYTNLFLIQCIPLKQL